MGERFDAVINERVKKMVIIGVAIGLIWMFVIPFILWEIGLWRAGLI
jgi:hypothetical protein